MINKLPVTNSDEYGIYTNFKMEIKTLSDKRWRDDVCKTGFHFKEEDVKEFLKELKKYKKKIKRIKFDKPGGTFLGYKEVIEISMEDFDKLVGEDLI